MKTEILTKQDFQPIELKITIETKRELEFLWALFNSPTHDARDFLNNWVSDSINKFSVNEIHDMQTLMFRTLHNLNIVK